MPMTKTTRTTCDICCKRRVATLTLDIIPGEEWFVCRPCMNDVLDMRAAGFLTASPAERRLLAHMPAWGAK